MAGPMSGINVVDLGFWVAGPSCAGVLADWGASVVKVEPLTGDPFRGMTVYKAAVTRELVNPPFEMDNRGKRSIGLDHRTEQGRAVLRRLIDRADVLVSNLRVGALERAGLDPLVLTAEQPRLVYACVTGLGMSGPERDRAAYDMGSFWSRAGVAAALTPDGTALPYQRGGMGDHMTGVAAAGAIAAALFERERTGRGQIVSTSLLRMGAFVMSWDLSINLRTGLETRPWTRSTAPNPLIVDYGASDGKRFWLLGLEGDRHWPAILRAVDRLDLVDDPRFADLFARTAHNGELVAILDEVFRTKTRAEWIDIFDRDGVWWAPVQATHELPLDEQAVASGCFVDVPDGVGGAHPGVASPVDFSVSTWEPSGPAPELGQHTEELLLELGYDWDAIVELKEAGAVT
jgi:crotonobetainyl-CoA:carnitine CoA-transferase CaiB-like acyl-CoA transferase